MIPLAHGEIHTQRGKLSRFLYVFWVLREGNRKGWEQLEKVRTQVFDHKSMERIVRWDCREDNQKAETFLLHSCAELPSFQMRLENEVINWRGIKESSPFEWLELFHALDLDIDLDHVWITTQPIHATAWWEMGYGTPHILQK